MEIRKYQSEDYEEVYALWMSCKNMGFNNVDDSKDGIDKLVSKNPGTCFVAVEDGKIIGTILAGNDGRRGYVYHACVSESSRKKGTGTALVQKIIDGMKKEGISKVALVAFKYNEVGNAFWEKVGFSLREDLNYRNISLIDLERIDT